MQRITTVLILLLLGACANNAEITHTWVAEDIKSKDLSGVLVVAVAKKPQVRERFERDFTDALIKHGVKAHASYEVDSEVKVTKESIIAMSRKVGVDTVLVTTFAGKDQHEVLHPGRTYYGIQPIYNRGYYGGGYGAAYEIGRVPDFYAVHKSLHLEANLYAIETEEHLWMAASGITDTEDNEQMLDGFIDAFIRQLQQQKLVK